MSTNYMCFGIVNFLQWLRQGAMGKTPGAKQLYFHGFSGIASWTLHLQVKSTLAVQDLNLQTVY